MLTASAAERSPERRGLLGLTDTDDVLASSGNDVDPTDLDVYSDLEQVHRP